MRVYVLLFNPRTENEGIHTLQIGDRNKILLFETQDDATRYAMMLEAQDFPVPTVEEMDLDEVIQFCISADYDYEIIKDGTLAVPPQSNVTQRDWELEQSSSAKTDETEEMSNTELEKIRRQLEGLL
jgi:hypothetical protein